MRQGLTVSAGIVLLLVLGPAMATAAPPEQLDRGLIAIPTADNQTLLSWRLFADDPDGIAFHVYRSIGQDSPKRLTDEPVKQSTIHIDARPLTNDTAYFVQTVNDAKHTGGTPVAPAVGVDVDSASLNNPNATSPTGDSRPAIHFTAHDSQGSYLSIPTGLPDGYHANDASVGDLDGDGQYELIVHVVGRSRDNSQGGPTDPPLFYVYRLDGTLLWTISLGHNVREGAHYNPFVVYDLNGDGRAEFICKTADGTVDAAGTILGDAQADHRVPVPEEQRSDESGRRRRFRRYPTDAGKILSGPEYLTVFDGLAGTEVVSVPYVPQRAPDNDSPSRSDQKHIWGDDYGNRMDRFHMTVAYLDGHRPSLITSRGYYAKTVVVAWDLVDNELTQRWLFDSDEQGPADRTNKWRGQGNHSIAIADVDNDGSDEIIFGGMVIDDDGKGLYTTGLGHGDAQHTSDLDPTRPGLETWSIHEDERPGSDFIGSEMRDARTGEILFVAARGRDVPRGMAADIDPSYPGCEVWGGSRTLLSSKGEAIGRPPRSNNMAIYWDGDLRRELLSGVWISKWQPEQQREQLIFDGRAAGLASNNGSKSNPCLSADILGDWREELIARTADNSEIRIYTTTEPTAYRIPTLMHDRQYRIGVAWQNVGYNQPPHLSYDLQSQVGSAVRTVRNPTINN